MDLNHDGESMGEDILNQLREELRRALERTLLPPPPPVVYERVVEHALPHAVGTEISLFGLPVICLGEEEPFKGHYLTHRVYYVNGEEWWQIVTGLFGLYVRTRDGRYIPIMENGMPTTLFFAGLHELRRGGILEVRGISNYRVIEAPKRAIVYLDKTMQGKLPFILIDRYGILEHKVPSEFMEEWCRTQFYLQEMVRLKSDLEKKIREIEMAKAVAESEAVKFRTLLEDTYSRLRMALSTLYEMRLEVDVKDLRTRYYHRRTEELDRLIDTLENWHRRIHDVYSQLIEMMEKIRRELTAVVPPTVKPETKPEEKKVEKYVEVRT